MRSTVMMNRAVFTHLIFCDNIMQQIIETSRDFRLPTAIAFKYVLISNPVILKAASKAIFDQLSILFPNAYHLLKRVVWWPASKTFVLLSEEQDMCCIIPDM